MPTLLTCRRIEKNSLGHAHGFADQKQGNLFFDIVRILEEKQPTALLLENVRNLRRHNGGHTFEFIQKELDRLGYKISYQVLDAQGYVPQHRPRIFIVGFRRDEWPNLNFTFPESLPHGPRIADILEPEVDEKYTLSDHLWGYLQAYAEKHRRRGNGFGFGLVDPSQDRVTRTLSARYHKDGSEILIKQEGRNPRRLTPNECASLMGFPDDFIIPDSISDTQAYRQFGNSVVVPLVQDIARSMQEWQFNANAVVELMKCFAIEKANSDNVAPVREIFLENLVRLCANTRQPFSMKELEELYFSIESHAAGESGNRARENEVSHSLQSMEPLFRSITTP